MRSEYKKAIYNIMQSNEKVFSVLADSAADEYDLVRKQMPERIVDCGIAEANAIGVAAGLSTCGFIPVVYGLGSFMAYRAFEFVRDDIALQKRNVKIVGLGSGVGYNNAGPTHHTTEDIAVMTALPNMTVISPATPKEVGPVLEMAINHNGPVYIRMGKAYEEEAFAESPAVSFGKAEIVTQGKDISIICTGSVLPDALRASEKLMRDGIQAEVINVVTIKPIDKETICKSVNKTGHVIVVEEHNSFGGLGSIITNLLYESRVFAPYDRVGFDDVFCEEYGYRKEIRDKYGINADAVYDKAIELVK